MRTLRRVLVYSIPRFKSVASLKVALFLTPGLRAVQVASNCGIFIKVFLEKLDKTEVGVSLGRSEWALWLPHWQRPNYYLRLVNPGPALQMNYSSSLFYTLDTQRLCCSGCWAA